ncbi:MAG: hypothetical protein Q8L78_04920 [Coxiellaceae bacterium]|nr:hypothetical protein [Coxiellaceae bacterium]
MNALSLFGLFSVIVMLIFYSLEEKHHIYILGFSLSCILGSIYGFLQGAWPFGLVEIVWTIVVFRKWWTYQDWIKRRHAK